MSNPRTLRHLVGACLAAGAVYACTVSVDWEMVLDGFRRARVSYLVAAVVSILLTLVLVTVRWGFLVDTGSSGHRWRVLWDAIVLGQAVNIVVPLRFGEGARLALTCRGLDLPVGRVMIALAVERGFDMSAFGAAVLVLIAAGWVPHAFDRLLPAATSLTLVIIGAVIAFVRLLPPGLQWARQHVGLSARVTRWLELQESAIHGGWAELTRGRQLATTAVLTALILAAAASTNLLIIKAFDVPVPLVTALVLLLVLQAGTALVSVPGNIGVFHYLTVLTLAAWQVPRPTALALAIVLHAVSLGPKVVLGAIALATTRGTAEVLLPEVSPP